MILHVLRMAGVAALIAAGVVFGVCLVGWIHEEPPPPIVAQPSAVERFAQAGITGQESERTSPLIAQAELLAAYLNPPQPLPPPPTAIRTVAKPVSPRVTPPVSPPAASPKFKVHATSFCSEQPERSMVLISESGGPAGLRRWVNGGTQLGHFVIQEIRKGSIVCREANSARVHEMAVEHEGPRNLLVRSQTGLAQAGGKADESILDVNLNPAEAPQ